MRKGKHSRDNGSARKTPPTKPGNKWATSAVRRAISVAAAITVGEADLGVLCKCCAVIGKARGSRIALRAEVGAEGSARALSPLHVLHDMASEPCARSARHALADSDSPQAFLKDARDHNVLRTVGLVYQF